MTRRLYKKGISPIIATILLIALAVSIGATIISFGGVYWEKVKLGDSSCSKILINAFELEDKKQCESYRFKSIIKFYYINETPTYPQCYSGVATGTGDICKTSDIHLESSWAPTDNNIG